jgi:ergothioneine biosynthesis protein EgtB
LHHQATEPLQERYTRIRQQSLALCEPLAVEDYQVQPMDDASPPKWHLAHVSWFFETFLLKTRLSGYQVFHDNFETLFNSYYNGVGQPFPRPKRGNLSRPTVAEILDYRRHVDEHMAILLTQSLDEEACFQVELGLHHEQQHQELLLTDLKYNLGNNPLKPVYQSTDWQTGKPVELGWSHFPGGLVEVGTAGKQGFVFDNETPRHAQHLVPYALADRAVTNGEFIEFIEDGGYERHELWLSDGWTHLGSLGPERWQMPLYWRRDGDTWLEYSLGGEREVDLYRPVCHVSGYEADAYARWRGYRLPTEFEWEAAATKVPVTGNFVESGALHPAPVASGRLSGIHGDVWEWTCTSYGPYPGFQPFAGQLGEYNGKFMANQLVLRGGSCVTPQSHIRTSYRNFFYPPDRWQFTGIRLAWDDA